MLGETELEFTKEDQASINSFSKMNMLFKDKDKKLKALQETLNQQDDALTELEICDDDEIVRMKYGDCFFHVKASHAKNTLEKHTAQTKQEANEAADMKGDTEKKLKKLKAVLYAKFGTQINLEED